MSTYAEIIQGAHQMGGLRKSRVGDFEKKLTELRAVMKLIGKNTITLYTSEPIGGDHSMGGNKKYSLIVNQDNVRYQNMMGVTVMAGDEVLARMNWFQLYVYIVEMELELIKIKNHLEDSYIIHERLNELE